MSKSERYSADNGTIEDFKLKQHILWRKGFRLSIKLTPDFEGQYKTGISKTLKYPLKIPAVAIIMCLT